ncbi:hypothetical protein AR539_02695 [Arthrobacter sp. EPSL27]|nr:hypothetical protein AR539_02695 [Arthrobacter sp. EPSL27]
MGTEAVAKAFADIKAAVDVLNAEVDAAGVDASAGPDPLAMLADTNLDILSGAAAVEAGVAGLKARAAMKYAETARALAPPGAPVRAQEMAVDAEIAAVLAIGPRAAASFLAASHMMTTALPLTLSALQAGAPDPGRQFCLSDPHQQNQQQWRGECRWRRRRNGCRVVFVSAGPGAGHRAGTCPDGPHRRTSHAGRFRPHPTVHGEESGREWG